MIKFQTNGIKAHTIEVSTHGIMYRILQASSISLILQLLFLQY